MHHTGLAYNGNLDGGDGGKDTIQLIDQQLPIKNVEQRNVCLFGVVVFWGFLFCFVFVVFSVER